MMDQTHTMLEFKDDYIDRIYWAGKAVNEAHGHKDWGKGKHSKSRHDQLV